MDAGNLLVSSTICTFGIPLGRGLGATHDNGEQIITHLQATKGFAKETVDSSKVAEILRELRLGAVQLMRLAIGGKAYLQIFHLPLVLRRLLGDLLKSILQSIQSCQRYGSEVTGR